MRRNAAASGPISAFGKHVWQSVLVNRTGTALAAPSVVSADRTSFTVSQ